LEIEFLTHAIKAGSFLGLYGPTKSRALTQSLSVVTSENTRFLKVQQADPTHGNPARKVQADAERPRWTLATPPTLQRVILRVAYVILNLR
jgi:hypothetical protein